MGNEVAPTLERFQSMMHDRMTGDYMIGGEMMKH
jgi:hypothetical protein